MYLRQPEIAGITVNSIRKGVELGHYQLGAYVVMANHVHLLIRSAIAPGLLMKSLKGATAREANRLLGRTGQVRGYIENNPVKAGIVGDARACPWSSAGVETSLYAARKSACAALF